ncbi:MAG TPA: hypothetical protein VMG12_40475, partial [Polyangiaceae bacterium]|nr:hypothetical protein [Polyangiaceae bacterium]
RAGRRGRVRAVACTLIARALIARALIARALIARAPFQGHFSARAARKRRRVGRLHGSNDQPAIPPHRPRHEHMPLGLTERRG